MKKKRIRTPAQLANDQRLKDMAQARRENAAEEALKQDAQADTQAEDTQAVPAVGPIESVDVQDDKKETDIEAIQRQLDELMESNALLKAALLQKGDVAQYSNMQSPEVNQQGVGVNQQGKMIGQFEKYALSEELYPSPVERLSAEAKLRPLGFEYNYHLTYEFRTRQYDTKQGINTIEPEFEVNLWRNILDDDGNVIKRYRARKLIFHEDPQTAMVMAHENNIMIDKDDERNFLNEMRYLRVRDWLFDIFWPGKAQDASKVREEVIGNQLVEVVEVNSEDPRDMSEKLESLKSKLRA